MKALTTQLWRTLGLALLTCAACDDGTGGGANSNTNWLRACERAADCDGTWDCLCGVCTETCEDSCRTAGAACVRTDTPAHDLQCDGTSDPVTALCLQGCAAQPEALFCSSFEAEALAAEAATLIDGGELARSAAIKLSGSGALAAAIHDGAYRSRARYDIEPQTAGTLYLRAWLYLDIADASQLHAHTLTLGSVDTASYGANLHIEDGKLGLSLPVAGDIDGAVAVPAQSWFCVRLEVVLGADDGTARVWLNDALSAEVDGADTLPPNGVRNLSVGIDHAPQPDLRLLVDDVLLSTEPVACSL